MISNNLHIIVFLAVIQFKSILSEKDYTIALVPQK